MSVIMAELAEWDSFYLIIGSAAGVLSLARLREI
jgi:hypothetical protein